MVPVDILNCNLARDWYWRRVSVLLRHWSVWRKSVCVIGLHALWWYYRFLVHPPTREPCHQVDARSYRESHHRIHRMGWAYFRPLLAGAGGSL